MSRVIELAIYKLKSGEESSYENHRSKLRQGLEKYPGFVSGLTFKDLSNPGTYLDYYLWESLDEALKAADKIQSDQNACSFMGAIENIIHFGHYRPENNELILDKDFNKDTILEFALGQIKKSELGNLYEIKPKLLGVVRNQEGLGKITTANSTSDETIMFDALCWESMDLAKKAMEIVHKEEACQVFMGTFEKDLYFGHLQFAYK